MTLDLLKENFKRRQLWARIGLGALIVIVLFVLINFEYVWKNFRFALTPKHDAATSVLSEPPVPTGEPNMLEIPALGIHAPIIYIDEKTEKAYQEALLHGVVHYPGTAKPGEAGNAYIFGHSSDYIWSPGQYKTVFAILPKISQGDLINVSDEQGRMFVYRVIEQKVVTPTDLSVLDQGGNQRKLLTLQTSYPIGTALRRYIVVAELVVL